MRHQSGEGEERKKRRKPMAETGLEKMNPLPEDIIEEIDPADFFDPEEFGVRRRGLNARRP
jgi:hypothetical protein